MIRSASTSNACSTIALPDRARPDGRSLDHDAVVGAERLRLRQRCVGALVVLEHRRVQLLLEWHADHVQGLHLRLVVRREANRGREHLLADHAQLHRHDDPVELRRRLEHPLVVGA